MLVFFNDPATTEIYTYLHTLSLHDALPIWRRRAAPASSNTRGHCRGTAAGRYKGRRPPYSRIPWPPGRPRSAPGSAAPPRPWTDRWYPTCTSGTSGPGTRPPHRGADRKSVVKGKRVSVRVELGGCRSIKKKNYVDTADIEATAKTSIKN